MMRISLLGSTGSIGTQVLDVVERLGGRVQVSALAAHSNVELLARQARRWRPGLVCIGDASKVGELREACGPETRVTAGADGWIEAAAIESALKVVIAVAGTPGLEPTLAAIDAGKEIALASKEVLVAAGHIVMRRAAERGVRIIPIDSEHSAIFQCINGEDPASIETIFLTASGGPFAEVPKEELLRVTPERALEHPTWRMGKKVTVDSATLMNKGLEIIEARWLFGVRPDQVRVVIHPQSIVHSMVRFVDGSIIAQLGLPDMRLPIQYALLYPERVDTGLPRADMERIGTLSFRPPDEERFPALRLAREAAQIGGTMPAVMNAADEVAVGLFLEGKIGFTDITQMVGETMRRHVQGGGATLEEVLSADAWARRTAADLAEEIAIAN